MRKYCLSCCLCIAVFTCLHTGLFAQMDNDGIMMSRNNFCTGFMYGYSSWKDYWEGTLKRDNLNLGRVSTQMIGFMGNYGVTDKLNLLFAAPYVKTKASAGTLHGVDGIQDLSLWAKYMPYETQVGKGDLTVYGVAGVSFPLTSYVADYLPLSIGLRSKTLSLRAMADYQVGKFFVTASGTYTFRSNIDMDRDHYYTTEMHYTNEVEMPNVLSFNLRSGYRYANWIAEVVADNMVTQGGFDITRNNMPFPSNQMNATRVGANIKYEFLKKQLRGLSLIANGNYVVAGRNVGQSTTVNAGVFYIFNFSKREKIISAEPKKQ
jgi:hypothetical protein